MSMVVFMGTAELARPSLARLAQESFFRLRAVVTQPDRPKGRELKLQPSPVKSEAIRWNLPILQPEKARDPAFVDELASFKPDLIVVAAYGQILPKTILDLPRFGCLNVHTSLLPKYRGAAPIQWAILNDEPETGVTIMKMDEGLDTGDILSMERTPIHPGDNAQTLHDRLARLGAELLVKTIPDYIAGRITPQKQPEQGASYARKIRKEDGRLDWGRPARVLWNRLRAFTPWPGAFTWLPQQKKSLKIWEAEPVEADSGEPGQILSAGRDGLVVRCGEQALRIVSVQLEGGRRMRVDEFLAGHKIEPGQFLELDKPPISK